MLSISTVSGDKHQLLYCFLEEAALGCTDSSHGCNLTETLGSQTAGIFSPRCN